MTESNLAEVQAKSWDEFFEMLGPLEGDESSDLSPEPHALVADFRAKLPSPAPGTTGATIMSFAGSKAPPDLAMLVHTPMKIQIMPDPAGGTPPEA